MPPVTCLVTVTCRNGAWVLVMTASPTPPDVTSTVPAAAAAVVVQDQLAKAGWSVSVTV